MGIFHGPPFRNPLASSDATADMPSPLFRPALFGTVPLRVPGERPSWRPDIEGLRGVAVLLVVLYHAGVPGFAGGYVGVDVFFALSGYLITGILASEIERTGRVDLTVFYSRRARRLLPAAAVLLIAVAAFAYVFYSPIEQEGIAETALATSVYGSNIHFALGATDYLGAAAETNPLLHTWSLAVEEQFYLFWPLLVLVGLVGVPWLRRGQRAVSHRRLVWVMVGVSVVTFALTLFLMGSLRTHWAFFATPARAWEFALGGLGAVLPRVRATARRGAGSAVGAHVLGWAGLAAVLGAGVAYGGRTPFPGWAALVPVVGTVWALRAGVGQPATALSRALSWRPLREAGRLSYSWYLWHWPVLVFAEGLYGEGVGGHLSLPVRVGLLLVSLVLAEGSYRLVEDPVRHQRWLSGRPARGVALFAVVTVSCTALSAAWGLRASTASLDPRQRLATEARADLPDLYSRGCHDRIGATKASACTDSLGAGPSVVLIGDSHAAHWAPALQRLAAERGWRLTYLTKSSCPGLDATPWGDEFRRPYEECARWRSDALAKVDSLRPDLVVTSTAVETFMEVAPQERAGAADRFADRLARAAGEVVVIRDVPRPGFDAPVCASRSAWGAPGASGCSFEHRVDDGADVYALQSAAVGQRTNVRVVDLNAWVCPKQTCGTVRGDTAMVWRDDHHLTAGFSESLAPALGAQLLGELAETQGMARRGAE